MDKQIKYLRGERSPEDILSDLCVVFGTSFPEFMNRRSNRKSNDMDALISQAFVLIMDEETLLSQQNIGKYLKRSKSQVSIYLQKSKSLLESQHSYGKKFKLKVAKSSPEGLKIIRNL